MNKLDLRHKQTLRLYLKEYFEMFFPTLTPHMNFEGARFLDKELIELSSEKDIVRHVDALVLIEMQIDERQEWILIHWEQQSERGTDFEKRMFQYFCGIYYKHNRLVFPIAMFTDSARWNKPVANTYQLSLQKYPIVKYEYQLIKLKRFTAAEFEQMHCNNPLMWAYLPLTYYRPTERPRIMARSVRGIVNAVAEPMNQATLLSLIDQSVRLNLEEQQEFNRIINNEQEFEEVRMLQSVEEMGIEKGFERGIERGIEKGEIRGQLKNIRSFLKNGVSWDVIEKATGITPAEYERLVVQHLPED